MMEYYAAENKNRGCRLASRSHKWAPAFYRSTHQYTLVLPRLKVGKSGPSYSYSSEIVTVCLPIEKALSNVCEEAEEGEGGSSAN